jgi:hypothetical protein
MSLEEDYKRKRREKRIVNVDGLILLLRPHLLLSMMMK